jgi:Ca2+-binding RTX toxin-like protein
MRDPPSQEADVVRKRFGIVFVCVLVGSFVLPALPAGAAPRCFGKAATIVGTNKGERLRGTRGNDVIVARGGHDLINSGGGKDRICGGTGDDVLLAGPGKDFLDGQLGSDFLAGGPSRDRLLGGGGEFDILRGNQGNDTLLGEAGFDILLGEAGNDRLDGGEGVFDRASFFFSATPVIADLNTGIASGEGSDTLAGIEDLEGSLHGDTLTGNAIDNFFFPLGGDDLVTGGDGLDLVSFFGAPVPVNANLATGLATGDGTDTLVTMEDLVGTEHLAGDDLTGDANQNLLFGVEGDDRLFGMEGDDFLDGGSESDTLDGGPHVVGDQCVNGEVLLECELLGPARAESKVASRSAAQLRRVLAATGETGP